MAMLDLKDKLLFIAHGLPGATKERWYLVQVDMEETREAAAYRQGIHQV